MEQRFVRAQTNGAVSGSRMGLIVSSVFVASHLFSNGWPSMPWWFGYFCIFIAVRSATYLIVYWLTLFYIEPPAFLLPQEDMVVSEESNQLPDLPPEPKRPQLPKRPHRPDEPTKSGDVAKVDFSIKPSFPPFPYGNDVMAALVQALNSNRNMLISGRSLDRAGVVPRDGRADSVSSGEIIEWMKANGIIRHIGNNQHTINEFGEAWLDHLSPYPTT